MQKVQKMLQKYGLSDQEITIYLHLLGSVESSAYKISKELRIPRSTVYDRLEDLEEKGLIASAKINNVKHYTPESLQSFVQSLEEKKEAIEQAIPILREISANADIKKPSVRFYIGKKEMQVVWEEILDTYKYSGKKEMYAITHSNLYALFPQYFPKWTKKRVALGIQAKLIRPRGDVLHAEESGFLREYHFIEPDCLIPSQVITFGNKTGIFVFHKEKPQTIIIESKEVTALFDGLLKFMWNNSEK